jgi:UDP-N-acetyl-D-mannosaminuronate dehydrogenase
LLQNALNQLGMPTQGAKVGVYGLSYKANIGDIRESPALDVIKKLKTEKKAQVKAFDPYILSESDVTSLDQLLEWADVLLICTAHAEITDCPPKKLQKLKLVVDGRNCLNPEIIKSLGINYKGIGRN